MLDQVNIERILFFDVETVPEVYRFSDLDDRAMKLWDIKSKYFQETKSINAEEAYSERAGIYAEFGKIICISAGIISPHEDGLKFRIKSFYGHDEKQILIDFASLLDKLSDKGYLLCGHNIKEFDIPFVARRMLVNGLKLPFLLNLYGKKPWEVSHLDTLDLWKFGDYKHYTSLDLLTHIFRIPSPKDDISGADCAHVYWRDNDLERIKKYCEKDTLTVAQLLLRFKNLPLIGEEMVYSVDSGI